VPTDKPDVFYPNQSDVGKIIRDDAGKLVPDVNTQRAIILLEEAGNVEMAMQLRAQNISHSAKDRSFHYLPYMTGSGFEKTFIKEVPTLEAGKELGIEVYYNGDRSLTEFKICCYRFAGNAWSYIGKYTPDFLLIKRKNEEINKVVIVETKGRIYANDPTFQDKRKFMETFFIERNNQAYGYSRFDYLYLEDTLSERERIIKTHNKITEFFKEDNINA
jgi:hypothetical protein